ncbi:hypothetical protein KM043_006646 [Ampulex compressa]|nr:hypothetical protein KM043_006646 [Ampulex compressa]
MNRYRKASQQRGMSEKRTRKSLVESAWIVETRATLVVDRERAIHEGVEGDEAVLRAGASLRRRGHADRSRGTPTEALNYDHDSGHGDDGLRRPFTKTRRRESVRAPRQILSSH